MYTGLGCYSSHSGNNLDESLVRDLLEMVDNSNAYAKIYRLVKDLYQHSPDVQVSVRLFRHRPIDARMYNLPSANEVAALIVGDFDSSDCRRDIIVNFRDGKLQRIHETQTSYIPLQYPLLFPYGEDGYQERIPLACPSSSNSEKKELEYLLRKRRFEETILLRSRRLLQQFVVDGYSIVESQRLSFIRNNQNLIRADFLKGLEEAIDRGDLEASSIGKRIVLPSSFTGGRRYMFNNCQDAFAICKNFGYPDLFLTITCNPKWAEIQQFVSNRGLAVHDRLDILCRVFKMKLDAIMADFKKGEFFGRVLAGMYTIEFQKRGLPHAHILLWLERIENVERPQIIDSFICAELPDPIMYPKLFKLVSNFMIHGPCGVVNRKSPRMIDGRCSKFYPKKFVGKTSFDNDGYPIYRRRDSGICSLKSGVEVDNRYVVPYNPKLLMKYEAHINIEYCNKSNCIKYLFKYINKGPDRVTVSLSWQPEPAKNGNEVDEIKQYYDCREQAVIYKDNDNLNDVLDKHVGKNTMFLAWMEANSAYPAGKDLAYGEFPTPFVYHTGNKIWTPRQRGESIGRLNFIPPGVGELFYMRMLLNVQKGCTSFESIRTVNNYQHDSFQLACYALGLLSDDNEFIDAINEAVILSLGLSLRNLFVALLSMRTMVNPSHVWDMTWSKLADGILYAKRKALKKQDLLIDDDDLKMLCLVEVEKLLHLNGRSLKEFDGMPYPEELHLHRYANVLLANELNYNPVEMVEAHNSYFSRLNVAQLDVYNKVLDSINNETGGFFFVYGHGGTGKTFLWNALSYRLRSESKIVLNVASSGIASLLLPGGKTAHSQFAIPLTLTEDSCCNIVQGSPKAELLRCTCLIIWDEAPMVHKFALEALDRTLRDLMRLSNVNSLDQPFGGKVVVLGGDFRQILPVIPQGGRADIVMATINSSVLWKHCKVFKLTHNMRLRGDQDHIVIEQNRQFANWILNIGDGKLGIDIDGEADVEILEAFMVSASGDHIADIVAATYPGLLNHLSNSAYYEQRAILAPTLEVVQKVNEYVLDLVPGDEKIYLSSDSICRADVSPGINSEWVTTEFLNGINCSGLPSHKLILKRGVPVILMRNLDQSAGLCNGTRLIVVDMGNHVIGAKIVTGNHFGDKVYIPRLSMIPSDSGMPFKFQRRQFSLSLCYAMTINKSQGQTLSTVGLYLPRAVFSHGQLYVAISRVKSISGLKILISNDIGEKCSTTKNIVYKEVFNNI